MSVAVIVSRPTPDTRRIRRADRENIPDVCVEEQDKRDGVEECK